MSEDRKDKRTRGWSVLHEPLDSAADAPEPTVEAPIAGPEPTVATSAPERHFPLDPLARTEPGLPPRGMSRPHEDTVATPAFDAPPVRRAPARDDTIRAPVHIPPDETDPAAELPLRAALVSRVHPPAPEAARPAPRDPRPRLETRPLSAEDFAPGSETALDGRAASVAPAPLLDRDPTPPPRPRRPSMPLDGDDTPPPRARRSGGRPAARDDTPPPRPRVTPPAAASARRARPSALPPGLGTPVADAPARGAVEGVGRAVSRPLPEAAGSPGAAPAVATPDWDPELDAAPAAPAGADPRPAALRGFTQLGRAPRTRNPTGTFRPRLSTPFIELQLSHLELGGMVAVLLMIGGLYWIQQGSRPAAEPVVATGVRTASIAEAPRPVRSWRDTVATPAPTEVVASFELPAGPAFTPQPASALRSGPAPSGVDAGPGTEPPAAAPGAGPPSGSRSGSRAEPPAEPPVAPTVSPPARPAAPPAAPPAGTPSRATTPVAAPSLPMLTVISTPSGADVELDGRPLGRTPLVRPAPAGIERLELRLRLAGHKDWVGRVARDDTGHFVLRAPLERR